MAGKIEDRLAAWKIELPPAAAAMANYVPWVVTGNLAYIAGQGPVWSGEIRFKGKVGRDLDIAKAQEAARLTALNLIAQVKAACGGDLDRVTRCVQLTGFVNCTDGFTDQPAVINGASDLIVEVFGDAGRHARYAVGTNALPMDISVEIAAVFEISNS